MNLPLDLPGCACEVSYPAGIFNLERHENYAYERFAFNAFREGVAALAARRLLVRLTVNFEEPLDLPAWAINCSVSARGSLPHRFTIHVPELLPSLLALFSHLVAPTVTRGITDLETESKRLVASIQRFCDVASESVRAYKTAGLATSIRTGFEKSDLSYAAFQSAADVLDALTYLIVNHEIGHIYLEQLTKKSDYAEDALAFEYLADLVSAEWLYRRYILDTPDTADYRTARGFASHAEALQTNVQWVLVTMTLLYLLMGIAGAQQSDGVFRIAAEKKHPGTFARYWLQTRWILVAIENHPDRALLKSAQEIRRAVGDILVHSGLTNRSALTQIDDPREAKALRRAADIAEERAIPEILPGLDFLRSTRPDQSASTTP